MPHGSKQRNVATTPDGVIRGAFGAPVAGTVASAFIYRLKTPKKVSVMTGKWELDQTCLREAGHALIAETSYGKIYSTSLVNAQTQFRENLRGDESHSADGSVPVVVKRLGVCMCISVAVSVRVWVVVSVLECASCVRLSVRLSPCLCTSGCSRKCGIPCVVSFSKRMYIRAYRY